MILKDIFGVSFKKLRLAHMSFSNQVGFEVFEFVDPKKSSEKTILNIGKQDFSILA
jgi:hypothetical protein